MAKSAERTDPELWEKVKKEITRSSKGGRPGQWSARKAQIAVHRPRVRGAHRQARPRLERGSLHEVLGRRRERAL